MKVLIVATSRKTRGGITSVVKAHEEGEHWKKFNCEWIETHIDGSKKDKVFYFVKGLSKFLFNVNKADIIHIHMAAVERKIPFVFLSKLFKKKIIIHLHFPNPATTIYNPKKKKKYIWCLNKANKVLVLSQSWKKLIEKEWNIKNIEVLYNPCPKAKADYQLDVENPYILYAGNLSERKGYADLLKAFSSVHDQMSGWRIKFAGNGEIDIAIELAKKLGVENKVEFIGWVNGNDKDDVFRNASAYCLPSYAEGFPMGVLDAWAYHLPVITTPVGGLPEIVENNINSLIFDPGNIKELSECLIKITDRNVRDKLSLASSYLAKYVFNLEIINKRLEKIYLNLS